MSKPSYENVVDAVHDHSTYPDAIITDSNTLENFEQGVEHKLRSGPSLYTNGPGFVGRFIDIPIWVDERFDGAIMVTFEREG